MRIQQVVKKIQSHSDILVVIGVGGSYLGARAGIEMLSHSFYNDLSKEKRSTPAVFFAGHHFSPVYLSHLFVLLEGHDVSINVISKSGMTTEPAIAFRFFKEYLQNKYGKEEARKRIYVTTDRQKGALKQLADEEGYETFVIPEDVGGRYYVLTAVGLLPLAVCGADIEEIMAGAHDAYFTFLEEDFLNNACYQYAALRNVLYRKGYRIELLANYDPCLHSFAEWWKQLFGESEGKDHQGIFPAAVDFSLICIL